MGLPSETECRIHVPPQEQRHMYVSSQVVALQSLPGLDGLTNGEDMAESTVHVTGKGIEKKCAFQSPLTGLCIHTSVMP